MDVCVSEGVGSNELGKSAFHIGTCAAVSASQVH